MVTSNLSTWHMRKFWYSNSLYSHAIYESLAIQNINNNTEKGTKLITKAYRLNYNTFKNVYFEAFIMC